MSSTNNELRYSINALRAKALFYNRKAMVYVEGTEDLNFWSPYFDEKVFKIESVGGCKNLITYIERLESGETSYIVACDSDYSAFKGHAYSSDLVVTTYGHSIENMMYCPYNLNEVVKKLSKSLNDSTSDIQSWYDQFVKIAHPLLVREICNLTYKPKDNKVTVFGESCARYCKSKPCYELDESLVDKFCIDNAISFPETELNKVEKAIEADLREERQLIKGHFLTHAVSHLVSSLAKAANPLSKKQNISHDYLYTMTVHCEDCKQSECVEKAYLFVRVANAIKYLNFVK